MHSSPTKELLFKTMKSLPYIIKFISRSRMLYVELYENLDNDDFTRIFNDFLSSLVNLMCLPSDVLLREHGFFLKSLPSTISDIIKIFDQKQLRYTHDPNLNEFYLSLSFFFLLSVTFYVIYLTICHRID